MTTTDTDALTERLAEAVRETLMDDHGAGSDLAYVSWDGEQWLAVEGGIDLPHLIADLIPVVAAEVRKAKAEAWDEGQHDLYLYYQSEGLAGSEGRNPYRETGDSDEHR